MPEAPTNQNSLEAQAAALVSSPPDLDLDSLAAEAVENLVKAPPARGPAVEARAQKTEDLADAVQKLVTNAEPQPAEPPLPPDAKIETLDAHIADLADNLIQGEVHDEESQLKGQVGAPPEPPPAPEPPPRESAPVAHAAPAAEPEPVPIDIPVSPRPSKPAPPAASAERPSELLESKARRSVPPLLTAALAAMSSPLKNSSKRTRDFIGWAAIITLFNATCLWGYLLLFRSAPTATKVVAREHKAEDSHAKSDSHAKTDSHAKADSHGPSSKSSKPKETKTASKKPAKKDAKAQAAAGHGGGH